MKIAIECQSQLLQKSLELFLASYVTSLKNCDIVIKDTKCQNSSCFYIGNEKDADLVKPFSKSQLILALENKYSLICAKNINEEKGIVALQGKKDFSILERRIEMITKEYQENILHAIKAFYET